MITNDIGLHKLRERKFEKSFIEFDSIYTWLREFDDIIQYKIDKEESGEAYIWFQEKLSEIDFQKVLPNLIREFGFNLGITFNEDLHQNCVGKSTSLLIRSLQKSILSLAWETFSRSLEKVKLMGFSKCHDNLYTIQNQRYLLKEEENFEKNLPDKIEKKFRINKLSSCELLINVLEDVVAEEVLSKDKAIWYMKNGKVLKLNEKLNKGFHRITIVGKLKGGEPKGFNGSTDDEYEPLGSEFPGTMKGFLEMYREVGTECSNITDIMYDNFLNDLVEQEGKNPEANLKNLVIAVIDYIKDKNLAEIRMRDSDVDDEKREQIKRVLKRRVENMEQTMRKLEEMFGLRNNDQSIAEKKFEEGKKVKPNGNDVNCELVENQNSVDSLTNQSNTITDDKMNDQNLNREKMQLI
jgi:hypothetical protein